MVILCSVAMSVVLFAVQAFAAVPENYVAEYNSIGLNSQTEFSSWYSSSAQIITSVSVNHFSGNVTIDSTIQQGTFIPLNVTYNSLDNIGSSELGKHFITNYNRSLSTLPGGGYQYLDETGLRSHFLESEDSTMRDETDRWLTFDQEGYPYKIQQGFYRLLYFNEEGKLIQQIESPHGGMAYVTTDLSYLANGNIDKVSNDQYTYQFTYGKENRLNSAQLTYDSISSTEGYDIVYFPRDAATGNLSSIVMGNQDVTYTYDQNNEYVTKVGNISIAYDSLGRATKVVEYASDGSIKDQNSFLYGKNQTMIIDKNGTMTLEAFNLDGTLKK